MFQLSIEMVKDECFDISSDNIYQIELTGLMNDCDVKNGTLGKMIFVNQGSVTSILLDVIEFGTENSHPVIVQYSKGFFNGFHSHD